MIYLSHPLGNANVRAALNGLNDARCLDTFFTSVAVFQDSTLGRVSQLKILSELRRRSYASGIQQKTVTSPFYEVMRIISQKLGWHKLIKHETGTFSIDSVFHKLDAKVAKAVRNAERNINGVYCYEDGAVDTFKAAKPKGAKCLYDLPIGYWRAAFTYLEAEKDRWPDWAATLTGFKDSGIKLAQKDEELRLADVIYVASSFTASTLQKYPGVLAPVKVIPYGFPAPIAGKNYNTHFTGKKIKTLFVGGLSQRKGIADLFAMADQFSKHMELTIVGNKTTENCVALNQALARHRWIPTLAHEKVLELMKEMDLLIFPSLFEGFGLVITEAMSQGTPVLTTDRTAGPDIIQHDENGWIVEAGSTESLCYQIEQILLNPKKIQTAGQNALYTANKRPWHQYGFELAEAVKNDIRL